MTGLMGTKLQSNSFLPSTQLHFVLNSELFMQTVWWLLNLNDAKL